MKHLLFIIITSLLLACGSETDTAEQADSSIKLEGQVKLDSGTWHLTKMKAEGEFWESVLKGTGYTLSFTGEKMSLIGTIDCNSFYTHYEHSESQITFHRVSPTGTACPFLQDSENKLRAIYSKQRKFVLNALQAIQRYEINGTTLLLQDDKGTTLQYKLDG